LQRLVQEVLGQPAPHDAASLRLGAIFEPPRNVREARDWPLF
jgi:hypothetical protein